MKKLEKRALLCLLLAAFLVIGLGFFVIKLEMNGAKWSSFYANRHIYENGKLIVGNIYDRKGTGLLTTDVEGYHYNEDAAVRKATLHVTGDPGGNVSTAANVAFKSRLVGYNFITGTGGLLSSRGNDITLTIDADVNKAAYKALDGRNGFISVYNWKTGEIICLVSAPSADPADADSIANAKEGAFINKAISATYTPGSTFKLVTTAAVIEKLDDMEDWSFKCTGSTVIDGEKVTCPSKHGTVDFYGALAKSCNCAYATLTVELGGKTMYEYVKKLGLTESYDLNGIKTAKGSFNFNTANINLGWAGIGQFEDQINPLSMMVFMGAVAGEGEAANPVILRDGNVLEDVGELVGKENEKPKKGTVRLLSADTAKQLGDMMKNNVAVTYGENNYPGLDMHAKSGTAENSTGTPHAWFTGYAGNYAFVVCVESSGYGSKVAGPVANAVLQAINEQTAKKDK